MLFSTNRIRDEAQFSSLWEIDILRTLSIGGGGGN